MLSGNFVFAIADFMCIEPLNRFLAVCLIKLLDGGRVYLPPL